MTPRAPTPQFEPLRGVFQTTKFISLTVTQTSSFRGDATSILLMDYFIGSNENHLTPSLNGCRYQSAHTQGNAV